MNRLQRRAEAKKLHNKSGVSFKESFSQQPKDVESFDGSKEKYCWRHALRFDSPKHPTKADIQKAEMIRFVPFKRKDEATGEMIMGRSCPKCGNTILIKEKDRTSQGIEGYTTKEKPVNI